MTQISFCQLTAAAVSGAKNKYFFHRLKRIAR